MVLKVELYEIHQQLLPNVLAFHIGNRMRNFPGYSKIKTYFSVKANE